MNLNLTNQFVLTLLEAKISLYPAAADGSISGNALWNGADAESLSVRERWIKGETRPTGVSYPRRHPLIQQFEISLGRVWALQITNAGGFTTVPQYYVLDIVWTDEDTGNWHRETFYNVTISERSRNSRTIDEGFTDEMVFDSEYMAPPTGGEGAVPAVSTTLPYYVLWNGPDGVMPLYNYDPVAQTFAEVTTGISATRAVLAYSPTNRSGDFTITFDGASGPALEVNADQGLVVTGLMQRAPDISAVPRVDFYYGNVRVASVDAAGNLYGASFDDSAPTSGTGVFSIFADGAVALTLSGPAIMTEFVQEGS
ncbi:MAG TPA: hypothetical protein VH413_16230 [Verrucomicrobiae bacterium]|jgi:hypothetical protein|nr:hypothetical protein [Verrucomicrobiae bacterium]